MIASLIMCVQELIYRGHMEIILIACSGEKTQGGISTYQNSFIDYSISIETKVSLLSSRKTLAEMIGLAPGPDFGCFEEQREILYKPAYKRYSGIVYRKSDITNVFPLIKNKKVVIVSALYGLIDANDLIRDYDLRMDEKLPNGVKLAKWWKTQNLGKTLEEYLLAEQPNCVHDLLSKVYRTAIAPWPPISFTQRDIQYKSYEYPGLGTGSLWHRGEDLRNILTN